jgi:hypothetical protein
LYPDGLIGLQKIIFFETISVGNEFQKCQKITFPDIIIPHNIIYPAVKVKLHMTEGTVIFHQHMGYKHGPASFA